MPVQLLGQRKLAAGWDNLNRTTGVQLAGDMLPVSSNIYTYQE